MTYQLQILGKAAATEPDALIPEVGAAIAAVDAWERFIEVRMAAGPTVRISAGGRAGHEVRVTWGSQNGSLRTRTLRSAIEAADRLAYVFYEMRYAGLIQDRPAGQ